MIKLIFDYILVIIFSPIIFLMYLVGSIIVLLSDGFPIHYKTLRVGKNNRDFKIYKLRTMVKDADKIGSGITDNNDPRIFRGGNVLRILKLDELAQFINVLNRSMSIVGPRPETREYVNHYTEKELKTLKVIPGLACLGSLYYYIFQIEEGNENYLEYQMPTKLKWDLYYINKCKRYSVIYDIFIIFLTLFVIVVNLTGYDIKRINFIKKFFNDQKIKDI